MSSGWTSFSFDGGTMHCGTEGQDTTMSEAVHAHGARDTVHITWQLWVQ